MENEDMYQTALQIARAAHYNQFDKAGVPYIQHVLAVSRLCKDPKAKIAGLLHDVLEDTTVTYEDMLRAGISKEILDAVVLVTKNRDGFKEKDYFKAIKANPIAREVKMSDLLHNMDLRRLPKITERDIRRNTKYYSEYLYLLREDEKI